MYLTREGAGATLPPLATGRGFTSGGSEWRGFLLKASSRPTCSKIIEQDFCSTGNEQRERNAGERFKSWKVKRCKPNRTQKARERPRSGARQAPLHRGGFWRQKLKPASLESQPTFCGLKQDGIQNGKHIIYKLSRGAFNKLHTSSPKIQRLYLIAHHETSQRATIRYLDMERNLSVRIGYWTTDRHARSFIKGLLTENQGRTSASLFMAGLRVKIQGHQFTLLWNVRSHLPDLVALCVQKEFLCPVVSGHLGKQILNPVPSSNSDCFLDWFHDNRILFRREFNLKSHPCFEL